MRSKTAMHRQFYSLRLILLTLLLVCTLLAFQPTQAGSDKTTDTASDENTEQLAAILAIEADAEYGEYLGNECLTCHAVDKANGAIPQIHGKEKAYLASAILEYKNKQRENEVMRGIAAALTDEEIAALAEHLSMP